MATVLGIETSCDETAVAVYDRHRGLLSHCLFSQIDLHARYGGVVPELAARDHVRRLPGLVAQALDEANLALADMDAIAYTAGPGLVGALLVGASCARGMAFAADLPALGVHHMEGHLLAPLLEDPAPSPPFVALLVSGGHTLLVGVAQIGQYEVLGQSLDDAAGEAFDKTAKLLELGYPGGPAIARLAERGVAGRFAFTRPMCNRPGLDFSFSGLKTQVLTAWSESGGSDQERADVAREFEETVADTLRIKCERALRETGYDALVVAGGVGANLRLRARLADMAKKRRVQVYFPRHEFCTDNAAMIALAGALRWAQADRSLAIEVHPRWDLQTLPPVAAHG